VIRETLIMATHLAHDGTECESEPIIVETGPQATTLILENGSQYIVARSELEGAVAPIATPVRRAA
jgi:hypothetical protein